VVNDFHSVYVCEWKWFNGWTAARVVREMWGSKSNVFVVKGFPSVGLVDAKLFTGRRRKIGNRRFVMCSAVLFIQN